MSCDLICIKSDILFFHEKVHDERNRLFYGKYSMSAFFYKIWPSKMGLYQNYAKNSLPRQLRKGKSK